MLSIDQQGPPAFAAAGAVVAGALAEMRFPERVAVSVAARRHRVLHNPGAFSGRWSESPHDVRFLDRAMDALGADSPFNEVVVMGPAQTGKSEVGNNWQLHTVLYDPADMLFVMPDKVSIGAYVTTQWNKMLELVPEFRARQLDGPSSDNINLKEFRGCDFFFLWPSGPTFRFKPVARGRIDDYDDLPQDVGDQGDPLSLLLGRGGSFSAYGGSKIYANSTPKLGARRGIEALVAAGTDERWVVDCLTCGAPFVLDTETCLDFERNGTPVDAAASACVVCPDPECGGYHQQRHKRALMATGRWVGKGEEAVSREIEPAGKIGELAPNTRLSQRWDGLMGFRRWSEMAEQWRKAELSYELDQDEAPLKTYFQTVIGKNYRAKREGEPGATEEDLAERAKAAPWRMGEFPPEARCAIAAVDQQGNRFEVAVWAFGPGYRSWLVKRFAIFACGEEMLRPFTRPEHFAVLHEQVLSLRIPVAGAPGLKVKVLNTVLDTGGLDGATDNAFAWWHAMVKGDVGSGRSPVPPTAITLFKGGNNPRGKLLPPPTIDAKRQIKGAPQAELYVPNVNRLKDIADTCLKRDDGGPGTIHFPRDVDPGHLAEMRAETKVGETWERPSHAANETWDLYIMARTALLRLGGNDHSLDWVPPWARPPKVSVLPGSDAARVEAAALHEAQGEEVRPAPAPAARPMVTGGARQPVPARPRVRVVRAG